MDLVQPTLDHLPSYTAALAGDWSPDNMRGRAAADEELQAIASDPKAFVHGLWNPDGNGAPVKLPDGSTVQRLPGFVLWLWDGEFCGSIGFRWQPGTSELPQHVLGHVGYSVVPWKRRLGYATVALRLLLPRCRERGLAYIELTTTPDNVASQRVI